MHRGWWVVTAALVALGTACTSTRSAVGDGASAPAPDADVIVWVANHYELSMDISVAAAGHTHRLGLVSPSMTRSFRLPPSVILDGIVEFSAQPTGYGPIIRSEQLQIHAGHVIDFEIATNLIGSRATIRM